MLEAALEALLGQRILVEGVVGDDGRDRLRIALPDTAAPTDEGEVDKKAPMSGEV